MELPQGVKTIKELLGFYHSLDYDPAYRDLIAFLKKRRDVSIEQLKIKDDPVARATWNLVDDILERKSFIEKEAKREEQNKSKNKK